MHILSATKQPIELEHIPSSFLPAEPAPVLHVASETASPLLSDATRAFFGMQPAGGRVVRAAAIPKDPPPAVFRETRSRLMRVVHREVVIRFRASAKPAARRSILDKHGFKVRSRNPFIPDQVVVYDPTAKESGARLVDVANDWATMDEVVFATPNFVSEYRRKAAAMAVIHREQWHLRNTGRVAGQIRGEDVDARGAWRITQGRRAIIVAVLDDGVDVEHPNLKANIARRPDPGEPRDQFGRDFFIPDDDSPDHFNPRPKRFKHPYDRLAGNDIHGTPCAGVIGAPGTNRGPVGIAPKCRILPVKIFHADEFASAARVADAIRYSALRADVLSCSWSGAHSPDIELAVQDARTLGRNGKGAPVFCAAGNEYGDPVGFPASDPNAVGIGASTDQATVADYSNVGAEIWVVAPSSGGVRGIFCTDVSFPNRGFNLGTAAAGGADGLSTNDFGGTSSATPLVAGIAALMLSANDRLDSEALREILKNTAEKIGSGYDANGHSVKFGFGRVHAGRAVAAAKNLR
jgi:subtilisin family serine protease